MNEQSAASRVGDVLKAQIVLLETIAAEHSRLQESVLHRDWESLEGQMERLRIRSDEVAALESERHAAYDQLRTSLGLGSADSFFEVLSRLDNDERSRLATLYRGLKVAVMRVASVNGGLEAYVSSSSETIEAVLGELFPERKGTIYGRSGRVSARDGRAFVVNHTL